MMEEEDDPQPTMEMEGLRMDEQEEQQELEQLQNPADSPSPVQFGAQSQLTSGGGGEDSGLSLTEDSLVQQAVK